MSQASVVSSGNVDLSAAPAVFRDFIKANPRDKQDATKSVQIGSQIPSASVADLNTLTNSLSTMARSSTRVFTNGTASWNADAVYPVLEALPAKLSSFSDKRAAVLAIASLCKTHWTQKKAVCEKFLNTNSEITPELRQAVQQVIGSKIFKLINLPVEEPETAPVKNETKNKREQPDASSSPSTSPNSLKPAKRPALEKDGKAVPPPSPEIAPKVHTNGPPIKLSDVKYSSMGLETATLNAIKANFGFEYMTPVQAATLPPVKKGIDVLAKAKTGTGKTLAFLVPQADRMLISPPKDSSIISVLVIAPTRELALQIQQEGQKLFATQPSIKVTSVIGGTKMDKETRTLAGKVDVLVATPGRLLDHLKTNSNFSQRIGKGLKTLVFDECDQLMDMGFVKDLDRIVSYLPTKETRQTLLFSATMPDSIKTMAFKYCRNNPETFQFIDCVLDEPATHTHVNQTYIEVPFADQTAVLYHLISKQTSNKSIVFFQTARGAQLAAEVFEKSPLAKSHEFFEIHSRRSQAQRTKAQAGFAATPLTTPCVLFSSDASARGVDYPGVELVVQIGAPTDKEQYIHRLGRTARAGREGTGVLVVDVAERWMTNQLLNDTAIELKHNDELAALVAKNDGAFKTAATIVAEQFKSNVSDDTKRQSYQAWLGYFNTFASKMKWTKDNLLVEANRFAYYTLKFDAHLPLSRWAPPALRKDTVGKMGIRGANGVHVEGTRYDFSFNEKFANGASVTEAAFAIGGQVDSGKSYREERQHNRAFTYKGNATARNNNNNNN